MACRIPQAAVIMCRTLLCCAAVSACTLLVKKLHHFIMAAVWNRAGHYIFILWFLLLSFFLFSSPYLSLRRLDVCMPYYHTWCGLSLN